MKLHPQFQAWFRERRWKPFPFQTRTWRAYARGESGLVHAPTGMGKTLAVWIPPVQEWLAEHPDSSSWSQDAETLRVLWITPLRALAHDTVLSLRSVTEGLGLPWTVETRTGDTPSAQRARQRRRLPTALVTTPESLSILLSYPDLGVQLDGLRAIVVDEWHELMGSKRGVQTELGLAHLRARLPRLRTWGLSATLRNLDEALAVLLGSAQGATTTGRVIPGRRAKRVIVETLLPKDMDRFPWSGHLGLKMLPQVIRAIQRAGTTLVFTNVRSQTEAWYQALLEAKPDWEDQIGIHHGSIDRESREEIETRLRKGAIRAVVCTSSLDLGVDFSPVDQVIQIGGPKGIARLLQRAGRSGHRPGAASRIVCVPTQALELVEYAAARAALQRREIEPRRPVARPLDLLAQHLVTIALAGNVSLEQLKTEVRSTHAYRELTELEWQWVVDFVTRGGACLRAYPQFQRVILQHGRLSVQDPHIERMHRMSIGTISNDETMMVKWVKGGNLGTVEEGFLARMKPGSRFCFAGKSLELVRIHQMTAQVRRSKSADGSIPVWAGGKSPLSSELAAAVRRELEKTRRGQWRSPELKAVRPVLEIQRAWSRIPAPDELLIETTVTREGRHWFVFPFAGRLAHEGLSALVAHRLSRARPLSIITSHNDYGFELLPAADLTLAASQWRDLLRPDNLLEDLRDCLNATELSKRQFREIARVAGLVFQGFPGAHKPARHLQASSGLFFDVFQKYEPDNLLLDQARREVLERQLEFRRLREALEACARMELRVVETERLTPFAFPLWAEMLRGQVSSETWSERVRRMVAWLEEQAGDGP